MSTPYTSEQYTEIAAILTGPANENDINFDDFDGYQGFDTINEVQYVADCLYAHYASTDCSFLFGFDCNADGEISGITLTASIDNGPTFAKWIDLKHTTDERHAEGLDAAVAIAGALITEHDALRRSAEQHRDLTVARNAPVWPQNATEKTAFTDWQHEVANGDTAASFRAWFTARDTDNQN